jgi:hypothetical protein
MVILPERVARLYKGHEADESGMRLVVRIHFTIQHSPSARPWSFQVIFANLPPKPCPNPGISTPARGKPRLTQGDTLRAKSQTGFPKQEEGISRVDHILHFPLPWGILLACLGVHTPVGLRSSSLILGIHFGDKFVPVPPAPDTVRAPCADICCEDG